MEAPPGTLWDSASTCEAAAPPVCLRVLWRLSATQPVLSPCHGEGQGHSLLTYGNLVPTETHGTSERPHPLVRPGKYRGVPPDYSALCHPCEGQGTQHHVLSADSLSLEWAFNDRFGPLSLSWPGPGKYKPGLQAIARQETYRSKRDDTCWWPIGPRLTMAASTKRPVPNSNMARSVLHQIYLCQYLRSGTS